MHHRWVLGLIKGVYALEKEQTRPKRGFLYIRGGT